MTPVEKKCHPLQQQKMSPPQKNNSHNIKFMIFILI